MLMRTTRFGMIPVENREILSFPAGLIGLEDCRQWVLLADVDNPNLGWLQSTTRADTALPVVSPRRFVPDYRFRAFRSELAPLELESLDDAYVLAVVSGRADRLTLNLKAPIVVNLKTRTARQITVNDDYPIQFALPSPVVRMKRIA